MKARIALTILTLAAILPLGCRKQKDPASIVDAEQPKVEEPAPKMPPLAKMTTQGNGKGEDYLKEAKTIRQKCLDAMLAEADRRIEVYLAAYWDDVARQEKRRKERMAEQYAGMSQLDRMAVSRIQANLEKLDKGQSIGPPEMRFVNGRRVKVLGTALEREEMLLIQQYPDFFNPDQLDRIVNKSADFQTMLKGAGVKARDDNAEYTKAVADFNRQSNKAADEVARIYLAARPIEGKEKAEKTAGIAIKMQAQLLKLTDDIVPPARKKHQPNQ